MAFTTCIIQARCQSQRLPGKVLMPLGGKPVLQHVVERCQAIEGVDHVIVASPTGVAEDPISELIDRFDVISCRGSLNDVLSRYWHAAQMTQSQYIMRVTADCPLLDPAVCADLIKKAIDDNADYGGTGGWPHGLDCEIFTRDLLNAAHQKATKAVDREHVTLWMKAQNHIRKTFLASANADLHTENRWVVDYPEDYEFMCALFEHMPDHKMPSWQDVLSVLDRNPALRAINGHLVDEWAKKTAEIYRQSNTSLQFR